MEAADTCPRKVAEIDWASEAVGVPRGFELGKMTRKNLKAGQKVEVGVDKPCFYLKKKTYSESELDDVSLEVPDDVPDDVSEDESPS